MASDPRLCCNSLAAATILLVFTLTVFLNPHGQSRYLSHTRRVIHDTFRQTRSLRKKTKKSSGGYNILSLGGSSTWGATIPGRATNAYPNILGAIPGNSVRNEAVRASGAEYPSYCIETIVGPGNDQFDVILLEFSINGYEGLEFLVKRLRLRYPDAIMIYIHLYSLQVDLQDSFGRTPFIINDIALRSRQFWTWGPGQRASLNVHRKVSHIMHRYGGHVYAFPRTGYAANAERWFAIDWHHLSVDGHEVVADGVKELIDKFGKKYSRDKARVGSWGEGDQCTNWFMDGNCPLEYGGDTRLAPFDGFGGLNKFAIEFKGRGSILFENKKSHPVPLFISYMTKKDNYPVAEVRIGRRIRLIDPQRESTPRHIMTTHFLGWSKPGVNKLHIKPVGEWLLPFRITGIIECGACIEHNKREIIASMKLDERDFNNS